MSTLKVFGILLIITALFAVQGLSQGIGVLEAHAISYNDGQWELCTNPIKVILTDDKISIYSDTFQEYIVISGAGSVNNENGSANGWLCVDLKGVRCLVYLGRLSTDNLGIYLMVKYNNANWTYRCYKKN